MHQHNVLPDFGTTFLFSVFQLFLALAVYFPYQVNFIIKEEAINFVLPSYACYVHAETP